MKHTFYQLNFQFFLEVESISHENEVWSLWNDQDFFNFMVLVAGFLVFSLKEIQHFLLSIHALISLEIALYE